MIEEIEAVFGASKRGHGYIRIRCPYHADGKERNPSMSILTQAKNGFEEGFCKCFTCGWTGSIQQLFRDAGFSYKAKPQQSVKVSIVLQIKAAKTKAEMPLTYSPYLAKRGISQAIQHKFRTYEDGGRIHMPVFDRKGKYLFKISRDTAAKNYYVEEGATKTPACIEEVDFDKPVYVVESQINAFSLYQLGLQAVATLGATSIAMLKDTLKSARSIILAFDPDEAGMLATDRCLQMFGGYRACYLELPTGKDINDILCDMRAYGCPDHEIVSYLRSCERRITLGRQED